MALIRPDRTTKPDSVEAMLVIVLAVWIIVTMWLLERAISFQVQSLITWQALSTFFMAFTSILVIVMAIIMADMRKDMKGLY